MASYTQIPFLSASADLTDVAYANTERLAKDGATWVKKSGSVPSSNTALYRPGPTGNYWQREFTPVDPTMLLSSSEIGLDLPNVIPLIGSPMIGARNLTVGVDYSTVGTSSAVAAVVVPGSSYCQVGQRNSTGSTATGFSFVITGYNSTAAAAAYVWGSYDARPWGRTIIPEEPSAAQDFELIYGAGTGLPSVSSGVFIRVKLSASTVIYEAVTKNANGETATPFTGPAVNTEWTYRIIVPKDLSGAQFYVNNTLVQSHSSTYLPPAGTPFHFMAGIAKKAGTTSKNVLHTGYFPTLVKS